MIINVSADVGAKYQELREGMSDLLPEQKVTNDFLILDLIHRSPYRKAAEELALKKKEAVEEIQKKNNFKKKE